MQSLSNKIGQRFHLNKWNYLFHYGRETRTNAKMDTFFSSKARRLLNWISFFPIRLHTSPVIPVKWLWCFSICVINCTCPTIVAFLEKPKFFFCQYQQRKDHTCEFLNTVVANLGGLLYLLIANSSHSTAELLSACLSCWNTKLHCFSV